MPEPDSRNNRICDRYVTGNLRHAGSRLAVDPRVTGAEQQHSPRALVAELVRLA